MQRRRVPKKTVQKRVRHKVQHRLKHCIQKRGNTVTVKFENVIYGTAAAELLYKAGVIDDENSFAFYLQNSGYDAIIRDGLYQINIGDSYENIAKIITKS